MKTPLVNATKFISVLIICVITTTISIAQEVISTTGEHYENSNGSISWTIGEPVIETLGSNNNYLTQGFHQPTVIPTMGQWGLIICGLLFLNIGIIGIENTQKKYLKKELT